MRSEKERVYDAYLASAARLGDRDALGKLAERWHPKLLGHAWRLTGDAELAADITQDAWMDVLKGIHGLQDTRAFAAWAFRVVTRTASRFAAGNRLYMNMSNQMWLVSPGKLAASIRLTDALAAEALANIDLERYRAATRPPWRARARPPASQRRERSPRGSSWATRAMSSRWVSRSSVWPGCSIPPGASSRHGGAPTGN